jgi:hypothetical protein
MAAPSARRSARRTGLLVSIASLLTALWLTTAGPSFACSCVGPQPMATYAGADHAIFSGAAGPSDARGVPVRVALWFSGPGAAPIVYLAEDSFGDEAGCGTNVPRAGTEWIWVTFLPEGGGDPITGLCSPHGQLGTPEGDTMLADATATFGGIAPPGTTATDPPEAAPPTPLVPAEAGTPIVLATVGLGLTVLLAAVFIARRRLRVDA